MDIGKISLAIVYFFLGIIEVLLGFRFALKLLAANSTATFTDWVYAASGPLVTPFEGVFPSFHVADFSLELPAILGMIVYGVVGAIVVVLLRNFEGMHVKPALPKNTPVAPSPPAMQVPVVQQPMMQPQAQIYATPVQPVQTMPIQPVQPLQPVQPVQPAQLPQQTASQLPGQSFNDSLGQGVQVPPQQENSPFSS